MDQKPSILGRVVESFLKGNLSILLIVLSLVAGTTALLVTPREEEPQIVVPLADVIIQYPGGSASEVEKMVSARIERMLSQVDGVEYVYSMSRPGLSVVTVRFFVGEDREDSLVKLYNKIEQNADQVTPGIAGWVVKPIEIDDVPIVSAVLHSEQYDTHQLYRVAEEVAAKLQHVPDSARITIHGGERRVVHVYLDTERLAAYGLSTQALSEALTVSNVQGHGGSFDQANRHIAVTAGPFLEHADEVQNLMVGVYQQRPIYLRDVAEVVDGPDEGTTYSRHGFGLAAPGGPAASRPAVTVAVAKKKGSNAVRVARDVRSVLKELEGRIIPDEVEVRVTRDYGATANEKVNGLVSSLGLAVLTVIALLAFTMNWRAGIIVAIAVPITYSLTLLCNYLLGYTINRVTLFALILALGLLVDDPIVGVENIQRHLRLGHKSRLQAVVAAMNEVLPPILLSTLAIIIAFTPMAFITGMMGPYMGPMALNVPIAVAMSTIVALTITPWLSSHLLKSGSKSDKPYDLNSTTTYRIYRQVMDPLITSRGKSRMMLAVVGLLFVFSLGLAATGRVPLKMLPFDNKNEFQILVDMPESATLETTDAVVRDLEDYLRTIPEVTDFTSVVGTSSPMDFNGMVRHYYLRQGSNVADVRVNLVHRTQRDADSHSLILRLRNDFAAIGEFNGANLKLLEVPPGPPVLSTVVAEVYGEPHHTYADLIAAAAVIRTRMAQEEGVVDLDDSVEEDQTKLFFDVDREKAGRNGVSTATIVDTLQMALSGRTTGSLHVPQEQNEVPVILRLPREQRSNPAHLKTLGVKGLSGNMVQVGELGTFRETVQDKSILHKNLERVVYVTSEMAGRGPAYAVLALQSHFKEHPLAPGIKVNWGGEGEWKITVDVFRDLGIAFSVALLGIYILLVYETRSYAIPLVIMLSIPLTMIGIMPGFWLLNLIVNRPMGGFDNPVFFTATAMIGMIALSGIVIRNALVLIDFIHHAESRGADLRSAIIESGAVRFRPIFLTACTTMLGAWPITLDPIFSGLAWAIIFGMLVSTAFTLVVVPTVYYLIYGERKAGVSVQASGG